MFFRLLILLISGFVYCQQSDEKIIFFDNRSSYSEENEEQIESVPPFPGETPINDYLPLLAVAAVGLGFYYRKELNQTIKSN